MYLPVPVFGFICDRYGPAKLSLLSAAFFGPGYALAAATFTYRWDWKIMVAAFGCIGMGTSSMYFSGVTTCAKNFTSRRGLALALPIAAFGLSSLWQAQLVSRIFSGDVPGGLRVERVFLFFSVSLIAVGLLGSIGLKVKSEDGLGQALGEEDEEKEAWINADTRAFLKDRTMWWFAGGVFLVTGPGEAFINNVCFFCSSLLRVRCLPCSVFTLDGHSYPNVACCARDQVRSGRPCLTGFPHRSHFNPCSSHRRVSLRLPCPSNANDCSISRASDA
jgi:MFS family permease